MTVNSHGGAFFAAICFKSRLGGPAETFFVIRIAIGAQIRGG
jgi:hypothetical protein